MVGEILFLPVMSLGVLQHLGLDYHKLHLNRVFFFGGLLMHFNADKKSQGLLNHDSTTFHCLIQSVQFILSSMKGKTIFHDSSEGGRETLISLPPEKPVGGGFSGRTKMKTELDIKEVRHSMCKIHPLSLSLPYKFTLFP